jgi:lysozyme family protein
MNLTKKLTGEYEQLFASCRINANRGRDVDSLAARIAENKRRYASVSKATGVPWYVIGIIHSLEISLRFDGHLHNGDPLTARTVRVPAGRPATGRPPFTWEQSARDALRGAGLADLEDWSVAPTLFRFERFNGFGYRGRTPKINSPYLWSFSNHYVRGKFVADGTFSATAVSAQCGAAVLLHRMAENGTIDLDGTLVEPRTLRLTDPFMEGDDVKTAQRLLRRSEFGNFQPGKADGEYGRIAAGATRRAKWMLGYPPDKVNRQFDLELKSLLEGAPLPRAFRRARKQRLREEAKELEARRTIVKWARWGVRNEPKIDYSQDGPRLAALLEPGTIPLETDCSAFVTLLHSWAEAPNPNHEGAFDPTRTAFTGTLLEHCRHIPRAAVRRGDLVVWSSAEKSEHVAVVVTGGKDPMLVSHGTDAGPVAIRFSAENAIQRRLRHKKVTWLTAFK